MEQSFLQLKDVSYRYPDGTLALNNISLQIKKGKKIALLGNNGAGKSTLLLHLNAILTPTKGQLFYKGKEFSYKRKDKNRLRGDVGIVFQDPDTQLFSSSVYEDIKYGPRNMGLSREKVEEAVKNAMELTETEGLRDKPPHLLSIGQKKRVAIAGILAMNPDLMVLDEPTAGLDSYYTKRVMKILSDIHSQGKTIILSTHDVNLAYEWADEVIILHDGEIIHYGSPIEVFQNEEIIEKSHLEKPWIVEVINQLDVKEEVLNAKYPKTKEELFQLLKSYPKVRQMTSSFY